MEELFMQLVTGVIIAVVTLVLINHILEGFGE